jgi:hypothetical protein
VGEKKTWVKVHPFTREVIPAPAELTDLVADSRRMLSNYFSKEGVSGSPVVNTSGEIVGVHAGSVGPWLAQLTYRNDAIPVSSISKVLEEALAKRGSL